jgi:WD40 repeat protein
VAFSPGGAQLAAAVSDGTVALVNVATGFASTLTGHTGSVRAVAFSPDGRTLATASEDHTVRLWDAATATPVATLTGHGGTVWSIAFSPDGRTIASASGDHTIRVWDVSYRSNPDQALCAQTSRSLTTDEWNHYAADIAYEPGC